MDTSAALNARQVPDLKLREVLNNVVFLSRKLDVSYVRGCVFA